MILLLAAPAAAAPPPRDTIVGGAPGVASARISATAATGRYPIDDGSGATIAVGVTAACRASCTAADPQAIADFIGTLVHGPEVTLLTVQLDAPHQIEWDCGFGAQACYSPRENKVFVSGDETTAPDGASRDYVLAHEYGHHVARHRQNPSPFLPPLSWGTTRWSSHEDVCRKTRAGRLFPDSFGLRYFRDPGEAFAEAFARAHFPDSGVRWRWLRALEPEAAAFRAIRRDTLDPWTGRTNLILDGRVPPRGRGAAVKTLRIPLDGTISLRPAGLRRHRYQVSLSNRAGRVLRTSRKGLSPRRGLNFTVCGQSRLRVHIESTRRSGGHFRLQVQRP
jgi:hypothetical protein